MLKNLKNYFSSLLHNEEGQGMVEYSLLVGLIAIAAMAVVILLGDDIIARFQAIVDAL